MRRGIGLPRVVRFMLGHAAIGFGLATLFVVGVVALDPGGVGSLMLAARSHPLPLLLLWFYSGLTFGSVQIAVAVMLMETSGAEDPPQPGRPALVPVPVRPTGRRSAG